MRLYITFDPHHVENDLEITKRKPKDKELKFIKCEGSNGRLFDKSIACDHDIYYTLVNVDKRCKKLYFLLYDEDGGGQSYHHTILLYFNEEKENLYELAKEFIGDEINMDESDEQDLDELMKELRKDGSVPYGTDLGDCYISIFEKNIDNDKEKVEGN